MQVMPKSSETAQPASTSVRPSSPVSVGSAAGTLPFWNAPKMPAKRARKRTPQRVPEAVTGARRKVVATPYPRPSFEAAPSGAAPQDEAYFAHTNEASS